MGNDSKKPQHVDDYFSGFKGKKIKNIIEHLLERNPVLGQALSNFILSGKMEKFVAEKSGEFGKIDKESGRIIGAKSGNLIFNFGGFHNDLGPMGKIYLEALINSKDGKRKVQIFEAPARKVPGFHLDFETERNQCLEKKFLFEDPQFPANDKSLFYSTAPEAKIVWKRPGEIVKNPKLIVRGGSRFDVKQGELGDCWFLAALSNITLYDALFYRVVPPDQSFTDNYAGIFHFQFWHYGKWVDVVIDDRLPTVDGKLYYMHSEENTEFWSALVEKAYAKLHGGYENLDGGSTAEALEDLTGGLTEAYDLRKTNKSSVLAILVRGIEMGSLFGCSIDEDPNVKEARLENGLVRGHAYSITGIHAVNQKKNICGCTEYTIKEILVRLRNPWGNGTEWNGAWSDKSVSWLLLDEETKDYIGQKSAKDGEFWMSFEDFYKNFQELECCNLTAQIFDEIAEMTGVNVISNLKDDRQYQWHEIAKSGKWSVKEETAGGCMNSFESFLTNPRFFCQFTAPESSMENDGKVTVIVAVLQKFRRAMRSRGKDNVPIGFMVFETSDLDSSRYLAETPVAETPVFMNLREMTVRFRVPPGKYVIIPSTFEPNVNAEFLLRIFTNGTVKLL